MEIQRKRFLDQVVKNLSFPVTNEMKYILTQYFRRDFYDTFKVDITYHHIFVVGKFFYPPNHHQPCTLLHECPINKTYILFDYNEDGERTLSVRNGVNQLI
jgi:hypothetical protein